MQCRLRIPHKTVVHLCAPPELLSAKINLDDGCVLGKELLVRKVRSNHQQKIAVHHRVIAGRESEETGHAHVERVIVLDELAAGEGNRKPIHPQYVVRVLDELAAKDAIFTCDVGTPTIWAARYLTMNGQRRLLGSFNHGSMANALPQAIGAQVSYPGRQVVSLSGDGGLAMGMGDLLSLRQLDLPAKIIVFKNDSLAFVELEMKATGFLDFGTDLHNPDFAKMAEAVGILGLTADTPDQVRPMLTQALQHNGPALIEVAVSRQELSMPPTITLEQMKGFSLFMLKAVLNGRGNEIIDLASTNLFR